MSRLSAICCGSSIKRLVEGSLVLRTETSNEVSIRRKLSFETEQVGEEFREEWFTFFYIGICRGGKLLRNRFQNQVFSGFLSVQFVVL